MFRKLVCLLTGHVSTGSMLWWMCDRCHADFGDNVSHQKWEPYKNYGECKVTRSAGLVMNRGEK